MNAGITPDIDSNGLSGGEIVGIIAGALALLACCLLLCCCCCKKGSASASGSAGASGGYAVDAHGKYPYAQGPHSERGLYSNIQQGGQVGHPIAESKVVHAVNPESKVVYSGYEPEKVYRPVQPDGKVVYSSNN